MDTIQTDHKTMNKTFKKELKKMFPSATSLKTTILNYKRYYMVKEGDRTLARVEKSKDLFKGLIIIKNV